MITDTYSYFWERVEIKTFKECWPWQRSLSGNGYGAFQYRGSHQWAWMIHNKQEIPKGMHVCHSCDNPICCNPHHLFLGTNADNMRDKMEKGRQSRINGEAIGTSKLTEDIVIRLMNEWVAGSSAKALAERYEVDASTVGDIVNGENWKHVVGMPGAPTYIQMQKRGRTIQRDWKLTEQQAGEIMTLLARGVPGSQIAKQFGVHPATISDIRVGRCWSHLAGSGGLPSLAEMQATASLSNTANKLDEESARDIKRRLAAGETVKSIATDKRVSLASIYNIQRGKTWAHVQT